MQHIYLTSLAAAIAAFVPGESHAQSPSPEDTIVVTGELEKQAPQKAHSYIRELGVATGEQQAARWFDPICPRTIGLNKDHAKIVEDRIRRVVQEAGAPLAEAGCSANFLIAFTDGPQRLVQRVAGSRGGLPLSHARELKEGSAPIRWWYNTEFRGKDGKPASDAAVPWAEVGAPSYTPLPSGQSGSLLHYNGSMVSTQAVRAIHFATVVIDVERAEGASLKSVVDYAALVGMAEIGLGAAPSESVLSLFRSGGSRELTVRDRAFLSGLYQIAMDRPATRQRRAIVQAMVDPNEAR